MSTTTTDILDTIRRATEGRDAEPLAALYAEQVELTVIDRSTPPSRPHVLHGAGEVGAYLRDTCTREMTHEVRDAFRDGSRVAWTAHCRYPDGTRVVCMTTAELDGDGRIARQTIVQAWDD